MTFDYESRVDYRNSCMSYLLGNLAMHEPFKKQLAQLVYDYPRMRQMSLRRIEQLALREDLPQSLRQESTQAKTYYMQLVAIVEQHGLNPEWAMELIHERADDIRKLAVGITEVKNIQTHRYVITWDDECAPTKDGIKGYVLDQFEKQWEQYEGMMKKHGLLRRRKRSQLKKHMRWVFKRVCLKQSWNQIATKEHNNVDVVRKNTKPLINLLGLKEPKLKGGRPPK